MQVSVEEISPLTRRLEVVLPLEVVARELDTAYEKLKGEVNLKGFRKGKTPRKILEKNYGPKVALEVADRLIQESYFDALEQAKLDAVVHPEVREHRYQDDGTFFYQAEIDVRPVLDLGEYKGIEVELPAESAVSDEDIAADLEKLRRQLAPVQSVGDREILIGNIAVIDFAAYNQGQEIKQVGGRSFSIDVGSGQIGSEFEDRLIGLKAGEEATFTIDFPANFPNLILAGKNVEFQVKVLNVNERVLPELDDEFAKDVRTEFATLADLRDHVRRQRLKAQQNARRGDLIDRMMAKMLKMYDFEVPARLVAYEIEAMIKELESNLKNRGLSLEAAGMNRDSLVAKYQEGATRRVRGDFILKKIAELEGIKLADQDINKGFQRIADQYNMPVPEVKKFFKSRDELMPLLHELLTEKILDFLVGTVKIKTVTAVADQGEAPDPTKPPKEETS